MVQASALHRVVQLPRAVAGEQGHGRDDGTHRAHFRDADLVFTQVLQQERFERLVGAVHLVDQQDRAGRRRLQGLEERAANQIPFLVDLLLNLHGVCVAGLHSAHVQQLGGVVPLVKRFTLLQTVITLQAQQLALQCQRQGFGQLGFANARLAFQQQRSLQLEREKHCCSEPPVGKIPGLLQPENQRVDAGKQGGRRRQ